MEVKILKHTFFERLNKIDEIIKADPNVDNLKSIESFLLENASIEYFYNSLSDDIEWLRNLAKLGRFKNAPEPVKDGKSVRFPGWPESRYLVRMALKAPELVLDIILKIDTENIRIHNDFIDAALNMPPKLAVSIVPKAKEWLKSPYHLLFPQKLGQLAAYLAEGNQIAEAIDLVSVLLEPISKEKGSLETEDNNVSFEATAHFDIWDYEKILEKNMPVIVKHSQEEALQLLCNMLENAININRPNSQKGYDGLNYKRDTIEGYNYHFKHDIENLLVTSIRDAAEALIETKGKKVLDIIEEKLFNVFTRIGLYLRRKWPDVDPEGTAKLVVNPKISLYYELTILIQDRYGSFPKEIREEYLVMVEKEEQDYYKYRRLWPIQDSLNHEWKKKFEELKSEFGDRNPNLEKTYGATWVGPTSPKTVDELRNLKIEELISYLSSWQPSQDLTSPSSEGLGRILCSLVESESDEFSHNAEKFRNLDPTYVRALIDGLEIAIKNGKSISWNPVINLCYWVLEQPIDIPERKSRNFDLDPGWSWTRKSIAGLFEKGLNGANSELTCDNREQVWTILLPLTDDPDPSSAEDEEKTNMDPATMSINSTRGGAMHAVISYALWIRRHFEKQQSYELINFGFNEIPEVKEVLDKHLDFNKETSLGVHAVYGWYFPWLELLDKNWAKSNIPKIFPRQEELLIYRDAAWGTYINFCEPYNSVVELLHDEYLFEVDRLGGFTKGELATFNYRERFAGHFITMYWREKISLDELLYFFRIVQDETCAEAIRYAGENLNKLNLDEIPQEKLKTLQHFWETRIMMIQDNPQQHQKELAAFGWWFISRIFEDSWSITQLKEVLGLIRSIEPDDMIVNVFEDMVSKKPTDILECLILMVKGDAEGWRVSYWKDRLKKIISTALEISEEEVKQKAIDLLNILGARGFLEFRDLLPY
jgi:hypothetical protein